MHETSGMGAGERGVGRGREEHHIAMDKVVTKYK
jgi:hypothetical protein